MKHKKLILWLLVLAAGMVASVTYASQNQDWRRGAAGDKPEIVLAPESKTITLGKTFSVKVIMDSAGKKAAAVDLRLNFDKEKLEVVSFKPSLRCNGSKCTSNKQKFLMTNKDDVLVNKVDQRNGWISLSGVSMEQQVNKMPIGMVDLGMITFRAIKSGEAKVGLDNNYENRLAEYSVNKTSQNQELMMLKPGVFKIKSSGKCKTVWRVMGRDVCQAEERCGTSKSGTEKIFGSKEECEKNIRK